MEGVLRMSLLLLAPLSSSLFSLVYSIPMLILPWLLGRLKTTLMFLYLVCLCPSLPFLLPAFFVSISLFSAFLQVCSLWTTSHVRHPCKIRTLGHFCHWLLWQLLTSLAHLRLMYYVFILPLPAPTPLLLMLRGIQRFLLFMPSHNRMGQLWELIHGGVVRPPCFLHAFVLFSCFRFVPD
jgi:hypothetical protein